jgi:hypothetical protein
MGKIVKFSEQISDNLEKERIIIKSITDFRNYFRYTLIKETNILQPSWTKKKPGKLNFAT